MKSEEANSGDARQKVFTGVEAGQPVDHARGQNMKGAEMSQGSSPHPKVTALDPTRRGMCVQWSVPRPKRLEE